MGSRNKELLLLTMLAFSVGGVNTRSDSDYKFGVLRFKRGGGRRQRGGSVAVDKRSGWGLFGYVHVCKQERMKLMKTCCL